MNISNRIKNALGALRGTETTKNNYDFNSFLKYGRNRMPSTWSRAEISDEDFYTGLGYAVVNKRANRSVTLGKKYVYTDASELSVKRANEAGKKIVHPYMSLIRESTDFSERDFWYDISTYLDLEGVYYLLAVRAKNAKGEYSNVTKFSLLNPYNVNPVTDSKGNLGGYVERRGAMQREIPVHQIIPIMLLNPFDNSKTYSLADAARDSQFTMKQANDYAREAINGNINAPGILSSAIELPDDQFDNFVDRIKSHGRGEPLFGNGAGTVSWVDMQQDLDKAALDKINSINRDQLVAISGLSITGMGMEQTGTGREVSRSQKDDFTENAIMPQVETILDALNLDYRKYYPKQYSSNKYSLSLDNPLETNYEAIQAEVDIRDSRFDLTQKLVAAGYSYDIASKYASGDLNVTDLGEPEVVEEDTKDDTTDEATKDDDETGTPDSDNKEENSSAVEVYEGYPIPVLQYLGKHADYVVSSTESSSSIVSDREIEMARIQGVKNKLGQIIATTDSGYIYLGELKNGADVEAIISTLDKRYKGQPVAVKKKIEHSCSVHSNAFAAFDEIDALKSSTSELMKSADAAEEALYAFYVASLNDNSYATPHPDLDPFIEAFSIPFAVYFTVMFPIYSMLQVQKTASQLGIADDLPVTKITEEVRSEINSFAKREATSHINTVNSDLQTALTKIKIETSDPQEIQQKLAQAFEAIKARRQDLLATNAANRIMSMSQYQADLQFLERNNLLSKAYKVLFSTSGSPCDICAVLIKQSNDSPIPFTEDFVKQGTTIEADSHKMTFDYEGITAGNVHPNCMCKYEIIIQD